jgi:hypothetical protein
MPAILPPPGRDLRLDFFRGIANWAIFLDHIPDNAVNWITTRNWGFSDAADMFVFISGYTAAFVYGRMMLERGFVAGGTRILRRAWQIYVAHVFLLVIYIAEIGYLAQTYDNPTLAMQFNVFGFLRDPIGYLSAGLILEFKPVNLDVLPLYIVLMGTFPLVLWATLRRPDLTMLGSLVLYFAARQFGWNLPSYPAGTWYFNPFCWQLLFVFGAWCALGGAQRASRLIESRAVLTLVVAYLVFALFMTMAARFPALGALVPAWLDHAVNPISKTNLDPLRFIHFVCLAVLVVHLVPRTGAWLKSPILEPAIKCGQQSLEVFCTGVFLSFAAYFILVEFSNRLWMQIAVSVGGIALQCAVGYYRSWSKAMDKKKSQPAPEVQPPPGAQYAA